MNARNGIGIGAAALALMGVLGCCDVSNNGTNCAPAPAVKTGGPALLSDSGTCFAAPPPVDRSKGGNCGEVRGDLVYNLGNGAVSNSNAVRLMGGFDNPRTIRVSGGVPALCNPVPEKYYEALRRNAAGLPPAPKPAPAAPVAARPAAPARVAPDDAAPWEPGVAAGGYCAPVACPIPADSALVCKPGDNISDCFTLNEEELRSGPPVVVFAAPEAVSAMPAAPVEQPAPASPASPASPAAPAAPVAEATPAAPVAPVAEAAPAAPVMPAAPESAAFSPADKYANIGKAEALAPPPELVREAEAAKAKSGEAAAEGAPRAFPSETAAKQAEALPPVPHVTDMDEAVNAVLTREQGYKTSSLPEVELPPSLN